MTPLKKVAIFLMVIGGEKGQSIMALMDTGEIKAVVAEIRQLTVISRETQESVRTEFNELGYHDKLKSAEALTIIRLLFNGRRIR